MVRLRSLFRTISSSGEPAALVGRSSRPGHRRAAGGLHCGPVPVSQWALTPVRPVSRLFPRTGGDRSPARHETRRLAAPRFKCLVAGPLSCCTYCMKKTKTNLRRVIAASLLIMALTAAPALGQVTTNESFPIAVVAFVPCAAGGAGEEVVVSGTAHVVIEETIVSSGGTHFFLHVNYQGLTGVGESGTVYRGIGTESESFHNFEPFVGAPYGLTTTRNLQFLGRGPNNNFIVHGVSHVTINANDEVTSSFDVQRIECK